MADHYVHGSMKIDAQEKTFHGFITFAKNMVYFIIFILIVMAIFGA